jgi:hypothetical protein
MPSSPFPPDWLWNSSFYRAILNKVNRQYCAYIISLVFRTKTVILYLNIPMLFTYFYFYPNTRKGGPYSYSKKALICSPGVFKVRKFIGNTPMSIQGLDKPLIPCSPAQIWLYLLYVILQHPVAPRNMPNIISYIILASWIFFRILTLFFSVIFRVFCLYFLKE